MKSIPAERDGNLSAHHLSPSYGKILPETKDLSCNATGAGGFHMRLPWRTPCGQRCAKRLSCRFVNLCFGSISPLKSKA